MDPIANMLTSIRNAQSAGKETVSVPYSKIKMEIAKILAREKFLKEAEHKGKKINKTIDIILGYGNSGSPSISGAKRISKPSCRVYVSTGKIKSVRQGTGVQILSTPKGILTNKEARKEKVGGEVLCEIW